MLSLLANQPDINSVLPYVIGVLVVVTVLFIIAWIWRGGE